MALLRLVRTLAFSSLVTIVVAQQQAYQQCGGIGWYVADLFRSSTPTYTTFNRSGSTACISGSACVVLNDCKATLR